MVYDKEVVRVNMLVKTMNERAENGWRLHSIFMNSVGAFICIFESTVGIIGSESGRLDSTKENKSNTPKSRGRPKTKKIGSFDTDMGEVDVVVPVDDNGEEI